MASEKREGCGPGCLVAVGILLAIGLAWWALPLAVLGAGFALYWWTNKESLTRDRLAELPRAKKVAGSAAILVLLAGAIVGQLLWIQNVIAPSDDPETTILPGDCASLQVQFDNAEATNEAEARATGEGNAHLMDQLDESMRVKGCY